MPSASSPPRVATSWAIIAATWNVDDPTQRPVADERLRDRDLGDVVDGHRRVADELLP
jgi:hypothetical protein